MARSSVKRAMAAAGFALVAGSSAHAQVLSIGDDGAVTTYSGPQVFTSQGASPITRPAPMDGATTPAEVSAAIRDSAQRHAVPAPLVEAVAWQESRYNQAAVSPRGARGVMQLMPATATTLGVDPADLRSNIDGGAAYLAQQLRRFGDLRLALAAYNAGPEAVSRYGDVPPFAETQAYVRAIMARLGSANIGAVALGRGE